MVEWLAIVGGTIGALLPITNPFSTAPVFASLTAGYSDEERHRQARRAVVYMIGVLLVTLFAGAAVLSFFGIGIPALRVGGGLLILKVGFSMVDPSPSEQLSEEGKAEAMKTRDIAFTPIAMPLLSGPGSMAVTLGMASVATNVTEYAGIAFGILCVAAIAWLVLIFAATLARYLGVTGMEVMTRVMGFLLVCIAVGFIGTGVFEAFDLYRQARP